MLLDRRALSKTDGSTTVHLTGKVRAAHTASLYSGWGPWQIKPKPPPAGDVLEIRVFTPGHKNKVVVRSLSVQSQR
jgi:hypothetical protein